MRISLSLSNFLALTGSNFLVQLLRFLTLTYLARHLSVQLFGAYNYTLLILSYGLIVIEFGLKNLAIRELAQGRGSKALVRGIFRIRFAAAFIALPIMWAFAKRGASGLPTDVLFYFVTSTLLNAILTDYIVIAREELRFQATANTVQAALYLAGCLFFVKSDEDILVLSQLYFLAQLVCVLFFLVKTSFGSMETGTHVPTTFDLVKGSLPLMLIALVGGFQFTMDLFFLGQLGYEAELGPYSAATKILGLVLGVVNAFLASMQPRFARLSHDVNADQMVNLVSSTAKVLLLVLLPLVFVSGLAGDVLLTFFFGGRFDVAQKYLSPLSIAFSFFILALPPTHVLNVSHHIRRNLILTVVNVVWIGVLSYGSLRMYGPDSLPWAVVASQFIFLISSWATLGIFRVSQLADLGAFVLPCLSLAMCLLIPGFHSFAGILVSGFVYLGVFWFVKAAPAQWLKTVFG